VLEIPGTPRNLQPHRRHSRAGLAGSPTRKGTWAVCRCRCLTYRICTTPKRVVVYTFPNESADDSHTGWWKQLEQLPPRSGIITPFLFPDQHVLAVPVLDWAGERRRPAGTADVDGTSGFSKLGEIQDTSEILRQRQLGKLRLFQSVPQRESRLLSTTRPQICRRRGPRRIPAGWKRRWAHEDGSGAAAGGPATINAPLFSTKPDPYSLIAA